MVTKADKQLYDRVARLGCILCKRQGNEGTPCEIHHIRRSGIRSRSPVIGLCTYHHRGTNTSIHGMGRKRFEREYGVTEEQLLKETLEIIGE